MDRHGNGPVVLVRDLPGEHVRPSLVHPPIGQVDGQLEDVGGLHRGIEQLGRVHRRFLFGAAHDRHRPFGAGEARRAGHAQHPGPVVRGSCQLGRPAVADAGGVGAERGEGRLHVPTARADPFEVRPELVVDPRVPVRQEHGDVEAGVREVDDLAGGDEVRDRERARRLEADVRLRPVVALEERLDLLRRQDLGRVPDDQVDPSCEVHSREETARYLWGGREGTIASRRSADSIKPPEVLVRVPASMDGATENATTMSPPARSLSGAELGRALGLSPESGEALLLAGYSDPDQIRQLSEVDLTKAGVTAEDITRLRTARPLAPAAPLDSDRILERWVGTVRKTERGRRKRAPPPVKESTDVLRKWVEGDDRAMEDWIRSSEVVPAPTSELPSPQAPTEARVPPSHAPSPAENTVSDREETVVRWLTGLLDRVKTDQFDPTTLIQEGQDLHRQLFDERARRKQLEDDIEHVKRGSIAVIKYVRSREAKEREIAIRGKEDEIAEMKLRLLALEGVDGRPSAGPPILEPSGGSPRAAADAAEKVGREVDSRLREEFAQREHEYIERETELRRRIVQLEGEVRNLRGETDRIRDREQMLTGGGSVSEQVKQRLGEVDSREKDLVARENALRTRFEEIRIQAEEIERRRSPRVQGT